MVSLKHKQTGKLQKISRKNWETKPEFTKSRESWEVINSGDPVCICEIQDDGSSKERFIVDRDHAKRMIDSSPYQYRLLEISESNLIPIEDISKNGLIEFFNVNKLSNNQLVWLKAVWIT